MVGGGGDEIPCPLALIPLRIVARRPLRGPPSSPPSPSRASPSARAVARLPLPASRAVAISLRRTHQPIDLPARPPSRALANRREKQSKLRCKPTQQASNAICSPPSVSARKAPSSQKKTACGSCALRRDASAARVGGSCAAVTAPATTMVVRALRLRTAEPSGWAQKLRGVCL